MNHDKGDVALLHDLADEADEANDAAAARRLRAVADTVAEHVEPDEYECECGQTFETSNALGGHRSHCNDASDEEADE